MISGTHPELGSGRHGTPEKKYHIQWKDRHYQQHVQIYVIVIPWIVRPVRGDNPRALASGLSYVQVDKHGKTILYHLHKCSPCTSRDISC